SARQRLHALPVREAERRHRGFMRQEGHEGLETPEGAHTIHARVAAGRQRLRDAGLAPKEAELGARLLAEFTLGWTTERLLSSGNEAEPLEFMGRYDQLIARRAAREPLAYIVGRQEFWGLDFEVSSSVLIPRSETELIVEAALERFPDASASIS